MTSVCTGCGQLNADSAIDGTVRNEKRVVVAVQEPPVKLDDLVERMMPQNRHVAVETGEAVGDEVW
jgi:antitoxin component of MazEF toxin-antitoxin module